MNTIKTVAELIAVLQTMPRDKSICVCCFDGELEVHVEDIDHFVLIASVR